MKWIRTVAQMDVEGWHAYNTSMPWLVSIAQVLAVLSIVLCGVVLFFYGMLYVLDELEDSYHT